MKSVQFKSEAMRDFIWWTHDNIKIVDKIWDLLKDIDRNGVSKGIGKPERLKHQPGWSRRITGEHRLIYSADEKNIYVYSCRGHYE